MLFYNIIRNDFFKSLTCSGFFTKTSTLREAEHSISTLTHLRSLGCPAAENFEETVNFVGVPAETGQQEMEIDKSGGFILAKAVAFKRESGQVVWSEPICREENIDWDNV